MDMTDKRKQEKKLRQQSNIIGNTFHVAGLSFFVVARQNGRHFSDDIFNCIFFNENVAISAQISLKFVPKGLINNILALVQIMAWRWPGDKSLSEPVMVSVLTHICVTGTQWVLMHDEFFRSMSMITSPSTERLFRDLSGIIFESGD